MSGRSSRRRRVLMVVENLPVPGDKRVWQEATSLCQAGYEVSIISPRGLNQSAFEVRGGVRIFRYRQPKLGSGGLGYVFEYSYSLVRTFWLALKISVSRGFDVIHTANPPDVFFLIATFFRLFGKSFIFDQHDLCPEVYLARFGKRDLFYKALVFLEKATYRAADATICANQSFKQTAMTRGGVPGDKIFVVRNGPDLETIDSLQPPAKSGHRANNTTICYSGIINPQDGVDVLVRAADHLINAMGFKDVHFLIIGDGDALSEAQRLVGSLGLGEYTTFTGWISDQRRFYELIISADICVSPEPLNLMNSKSTFIKVMEYMALAKPIVAFDLPETRATAGDSALYAKPNEAADLARKLGDLLFDKKKQEILGAAGRRRVEAGLTWDHSKTNLLDACSSVFRQR